MTIKRRLSQVLGALKKGYVIDTFEGKFPLTQEVWVPTALDADVTLAATTLATWATTTVTTGITNPDVYRTLSIVGNAAWITGNVVITWNDWAWRTITETITANGTSTVNWVKPFATVSKIVLPARNAAWNTISVWVTNRLGLYRGVEATGDVVSVYVDWVREAASAVNATYGTFTPTTATNAIKRYTVNYLTKYF